MEKEIQYHKKHFVFTCNKLDLSEEIFISDGTNNSFLSENELKNFLAEETASFIGMWITNYLPHIDNFNGFNNLRFKIKK